MVAGGVGLSFLLFSALLHLQHLLKTQPSLREGLWGCAAGVWVCEGVLGGGTGTSWLHSPSGLGLCSQGWSLGKQDLRGVAPSRWCWLRGPRAKPVEEQTPSPCTPRPGPPPFPLHLAPPPGSPFLRLWAQPARALVSTRHLSRSLHLPKFKDHEF